MKTNSKNSRIPTTTEQRRQAEERLHEKTAEVHPLRSNGDTQKLVHELEVHQIELEMQYEELRQARDEVEKSLESCTDLFDFAPVGYFTLDRTGIIRAVNLTGSVLLGVERSGLIGRSFEQFVVQAYRPDFSTFLGSVITSREKKSCEVALLNKDAIPHFVQIEAIADDAGLMSRLALIDISGRKQAEDALRDSEDQMYKLAEMSVDAILMLNDSGIVTFCNAAVGKMFGCSSAEISGRDFHQLFLPDRFLRAANEGFERFREHGTGKLVGRTTEVVAHRKDGTEFPLELSVSALNIKGTWQAIAIMRDVTERKRLETEIQDARHYAESIVETVRRPLVVLTADLEIITANQSFYRTFITTPEKTIGQFIYDLGNHQWDIPKLRVLLEKVVTFDASFKGYEVEHDFIDIGHKVIVLNARKIFQENQDSHIILLAMEDITARKQLEAEIQDAREYAENIVETVREPLVVLNSDLKILTANHSFYDTFQVTPEATIGNFIYEIGNRQWDIPKLRVLFEEILPLDTVFNGYEVEHDFPGIGHKIILLNARQIYREKIGSRIILLAMDDITDRMRAATALQKSEKKFSKIFNSVPALIIISTLNEGKIIDVNRASLQTLGYQREEIIGKTAFEIGFWEDESKRTTLIHLLKKQGSVQNIEIKFKGKSGQSLIGLLSADFIDIDGDKYLLSLVRDITARKQMETDIQDAREYAENIVETVREPLLVLSSDLKILTANHSFYETFKVTPKDTIGKFLYDLGNRQWDIPKLRVLVEEILPHDTVINGYEVEHDFPGIGRKIMLLNARQVFRENIGSRVILLAMEDITARKQLEAEIQDAREYAENIVETVREPLVVLNSDLKILTANHSFYETFKVTPGDTTGNFIYDLGNRQWDIPKLRVLFEEILPHDTVFNGYEVEHDFPGIGYKTILLNGRQIFRENIGSHIILLAMEDITTRKLLETEIQDAREYAENIVETVREPLVVLNSDLKILTANHSFYQTFKVTPEDTIGNFIYDVGNRQWDIPKLRVLVEEILPLATVFNGYEVEHDFPGIGHKIILLNGRQIFRKNIGSHIILLAMEDITDRKLVEERISEVMRQQQAILDNIPNIAWLKDKEGRFVAVNEPFSRAFGVTPKDVVGKNDYDIYPLERAAKYEKNFREVMASGTRTYFEETIVGRDGKVEYVEKIKTPIFNDQGVVIGIIGIAHDVTNRKQIEVSLRHESTHDDLTGLYNRAFFEEELERFAHGRMFPISIVMADVNGLKTINDTQGHAEGDNLIRLAAQILLGAFRAEDIVARIGGDEFAVLLPGTDTVIAEEAVERIMSCPEIINGQVSIAFGVASAENKDQLEEALKLSDERMYQDKSAQKKCKQQP